MCTILPWCLHYYPCHIILEFSTIDDHRKNLRKIKDKCLIPKLNEWKRISQHIESVITYNNKIFKDVQIGYSKCRTIPMDMNIYTGTYLQDRDSQLECTEKEEDCTRAFYLQGIIDDNDTRIVCMIGRDLLGHNSESLDTIIEKLEDL